MGWDKILNYLVFSYGVAVEFEVCFTLLFLESSQQSISYRDQRHLNRHETGAKLGVSGSNIYFWSIWFGTTTVAASSRGNEGEWNDILRRLPQVACHPTHTGPTCRHRGGKDAADMEKGENVCSDTYLALGKYIAGCYYFPIVSQFWFELLSKLRQMQ